MNLKKRKKTWESIEPITANEVLPERLVNGGYTTRHLPPSSRGLVPISSGGKCTHSKLVRGLNHLWFFVMTKLFDYEYFLITNVCNCFKKFAGESKPIKLTWNGTFSRIIGFLGYFKQNFKIIMYSFCTTINSPLISVSFSLGTMIRSCPFLSFFFRTESIKSIQECSTMSKGCSSDSKHTSVRFSMRYLLFNVKAHKGQTLIRRSFTYR